MSKLIEALTVLLKYGDPDYPTHCEHDKLIICGIKPGEVSDEDKAKLVLLGFNVNGTEGYFYSYRFGSA